MWQFQNVEKYQDLEKKFRKMWVVRTKLIPVVMGDLGSAPMSLKSNLKVIGMCNQMVHTYKDLDKTPVKLFPNFTSIPFDYLLISWLTNYVSNLGFLTCLSWIVSIENSTLSNV